MICCLLVDRSNESGMVLSETLKQKGNSFNLSLLCKFTLVLHTYTQTDNDIARIFKYIIRYFCLQFQTKTKLFVNARLIFRLYKPVPLIHHEALSQLTEIFQNLFYFSLWEKKNYEKKIEKKFEPSNQRIELELI